MDATASVDRPRTLSELIDFGKRAAEAFVGRTHQWVAGENMEDAIGLAKEANVRGADVLINHLGERFQDRADVERTAREYLRLLAAMRSENIRGAPSAKPTQLGLLIDKEYALSNFLPILDAANEDGGRTLWLDMETAATTDDTIWLFERLRERSDRVGITLQANLKRTSNDLERLVGTQARIRLVKGAYRETPEIAFQRRSDVDREFLAHLDTLFAEGRDFSVASHDEHMIRRAVELAKEHATRFDFSMLHGVREPLFWEVAGQGHPVVTYISYGPKWFPYFGRGFRDKPKHIMAMARVLLRMAAFLLPLLAIRNLVSA